MRAIAAALILSISLVLAGRLASDAGAAEPARPASAESAAPASRLDALRGERGDERFEQVTGMRPFVFPSDHGPHPTFRHEWWYVTGNLDGPRGERFGFELTFFRFALAPPGVRDAGRGIGPRSAWRTNQIYLAHFAITDVPRGEFHFADRVARDALGLAGARAEPFAVWLESWSIEESRDGGWRLHARDGAYSLTLLLRPTLAPVLNGDRGLSRKSSEPGAASYYYSIPRLTTSGELTRGGQVFAVHGLAWLDREWGSGALGAEQEGWDWFALQLGDGSALMFYSLRGRGGVRDPHSAGTWIEPDGSARPLAARDVRIDVSTGWTSPRGGTYPARWRVRVPSAALDLDVRPVLADQELATSPRYWEGAVDVAGTRSGRDIGGRGYVELVGYAR